MAFNGLVIILLINPDLGEKEDRNNFFRKHRVLIYSSGLTDEKDK
jgi:hypothetical protein